MKKILLALTFSFAFLFFDPTISFAQPTCTQPTLAGSPLNACLGTLSGFGVSNAVKSAPPSFNPMYTWTVSNSTVNQVIYPEPQNQGYGSAAIDILWEVAGMQTVTVACASNPSLSVTVTVNVGSGSTPPAAGTVTGPTQVCPSVSAHYSVPVAAGYSYIWTANNIAIAGATTNQLDYVISQSTTIGCLLSNGVCQSSYPSAIYTQVAGAPVVPVVTVPVACYSNTFISVTNPDYTSTYIWSAPNGTITENDNNAIRIQWNQPGSNTVSVYATNSCFGNGPTNTFQVNVMAPPIAPVISAPLHPCIGLPYEFSMNSYAPPLSTYFQASNPDGQPSHQPTVTTTSLGFASITFPVAGTYTVTGYVSDGTCNTIPTTLSLVVGGGTVPPIPPIFSGASACVAVPVTYNIPFEFPDKRFLISTGGTLTYPSDDLNPSVTWNTASVGTAREHIYFDFTNGGCTTPTLVTNVQVNAPPVPYINGIWTLCQNNGSSSYSTDYPGSGGYGYNWNITGGTILSGQGTNTVAVSWGPGTGTLSTSYTTAAGCTAVSPTTQTATIVPAPVPTISGPPTLCFDKSRGYTSTTFNTEPNQYNYSWTTSNGTFSPNSGSYESNPTIVWTTAGTQTVSVTYSSYSNGLVCPALTPTVRNITLFPVPGASINASTTAIDKTSELITTDPGGTNYQWSYNGATLIDGGTGYDHATLYWMKGMYNTVYISFTDPNGCLETKGEGFTINLPKPTITSLSPTQGPVGTAVTISGTQFNSDQSINAPFFNGRAAVITSGSETSITTTVPTGASTGPVTVTVDGSASTGNPTFMVLTPSFTSPNAGSFQGTINLAVNTVGSPGAVSYGVTNGTGSAVVNGNVLSLTGAGTVTVTAYVSASYPYPAETFSQVVTIGKIAPVISFASPSTGVRGTTVTLALNSGGSTGAVTYTLTAGTGNYTQSGNTLTLTKSGTLTIIANIAADVNYNAASNSQTFTITNSPSNAFFTNVSTAMYGTFLPASINTGGSTGAVTYSTTPGTGSVTLSPIYGGGTMILTNGAGTATIYATIAADATYSQTIISQLFTITKAGQSINFFAPGSQCFTYGPIPIAANSTSNLPVTITSSNPAVATISGGYAVPTGYGTTSITVTQPGDANYNAASPLSLPLTITSCDDALNFNGSTFVNIPETNGRLNFTGPFTLEVFMKSSSTASTQTLLSKRSFASGSSADGFLFGIFSGTTPFLQLAGAPNVTPTSGTVNLHDGNCHAVAVTRTTANVLTFYVDGTAYPAGASTRNISTNAIGVQIARDAPVAGVNFNGWIGEIRFWNVALDQATIQANLSKNLPQQASLKGYYDMKDASTSQTLTDLSMAGGSNGILGSSSAPDSSDPAWLGSSQITCSVQGNFRESEPIDYRNEIMKDSVREISDQVKLYPNPAAKQIHLELPEPMREQTRVQILDLTGTSIRQLILQKGDKSKDIDVESMLSGMYIIELKIPQGFVRKKMIVLKD